MFKSVTGLDSKQIDQMHHIPDSNRAVSLPILLS